MVVAPGHSQPIALVKGYKTLPHFMAAAMNSVELALGQAKDLISYAYINIFLARNWEKRLSNQGASPGIAVIFGGSFFSEIGVKSDLILSVGAN